MNLIPVEPGWEWLKLAVDGVDIISFGFVIATFFGGDSDPQDDGETASGINTKGHPDLMGCALPLCRPHLASLAGSPLPEHIPLQTLVRFWNPQNNREIEVPMIDLGPAKHTKHGADLTIAAFNALGGNLDTGSLHLKFRILGAAKYLPPT